MKSSEFQISVIIPVYNVAEYLPRCLDSVVNQTIFPKLEVILVNDGSTDNSEEICKKYVNKYNFKYIFQPNRGVSFARNTGIDIATCEYISFVDSDDEISEDFYEFLLNTTHDKNVDLVCTSIDLSNKFKKIFTPKKNYYNTNKKNILIDFILEKSLTYSSIDKLYKKSLIENIRFDNLCGYGEDFIFNFKVLSKVNSVYQDCSKARYFYYYREGSITDNIKGIKKKDLVLFYTLEQLINLNNDLDINFALQKYALIQALNFITIAYINNQKEIYLELRKIILKYYKNIYKNHFIGIFLIIEIFIAKNMIFLLRYYRGFARRIRSIKKGR